jgi:hypothetical protein
VARFDAPLLDNLQITFVHQLIFDTPQLVQFLSRTPNLKAPVEARVIFSSGFVQGQSRWQDDIEDSQWLDVLNPFTAVKDLYLSQNFVRIAPTLQELVGERVIEVLPALQCLFLDKLHPSGTVQEEIVKFVAARQLSKQG